MVGNFLAHHVTFGDFMAGNFLAGDFLGACLLQPIASNPSWFKRLIQPNMIQKNLWTMWVKTKQLWKYEEKKWGRGRFKPAAVASSRWQITRSSLNLGIEFHSSYSNKYWEASRISRIICPSILLILDRSLCCHHDNCFVMNVHTNWFKRNTNTKGRKR